jgi:hypothetical protein
LLNLLSSDFEVLARIRLSGMLVSLFSYCVDLEEFSSHCPVAMGLSDFQFRSLCLPRIMLGILLPSIAIYVVLLYRFMVISYSFSV